MGKYSEIPRGYETKGETKEAKYSGKREYSPKQIADRIKNPSENSKTYGSRAEYHRTMADISDMGDSYKDSRESSRHRKKAETYELLAEKTKEEPSLRATANLLESFAREMRKSLESNLSVFIFLIGLGAGIFLLSSNITGNVIADLSTKTTSFIGAGLLVVGLVAGFFWVKSRKK